MRSIETVAPAALAAFIAARAQSAAPWLIAGVIPVVWNHVAPSRIAAKSKSSGLALAIALSALSYTTSEGLWLAPVSR